MVSEMGEIVKWNSDPKLENNTKVVNFIAHYECDDTYPCLALPDVQQICRI
jgi:hypothetical protein